MKPEAQRIAIAEACGKGGAIAAWLDYEKAKLQFQLAEISTEEFYRRCLRVDPKPELPDYLNDLNAMHEAWLTLNRSQRIAFMDHLRDVAGEGVEHFAMEVANLIGATAAQRAEAFLRTIGKWTDAKPDAQ